MCDFDLSQALDDIDSEESESAPCCFSKTDTQDETIRIDEGLELVVTCEQRTMKAVANLVLAANRLKKPPSSCEQELSDDKLCSAIMDSLVEETVVQTVANPCTGQTDTSFHRMNSQNDCTLCDSQQKAVILTLGEMKLQAITLKGGYNDRKVNFTLAEYLPSMEEDRLPIVLSIKNSNLHMSCSMNGDKAELSLEECRKDNLLKIRDENMKRFLFYKNTSGLSLTKFESVKCPGWFISTSPDGENQPVEMCRVDNANTAQRLMVFRMS